jgi:hypothetical protein
MLDLLRCDRGRRVLRARRARNEKRVYPEAFGDPPTGALAADRAAAEVPPLFEARTPTRSVEEASPGCTRYVAPVAPGIAGQLPPLAAQRYH